MKKQNLHKLFLLFLMSFIGGWTLYGQVILSVSMSTTPACSLDGSATATVTGGTPPYSYSWYGPTGSLTTTTNTLTGVPGGTYYLYVTDAGNGWGSQSFAIGMPFQPTLTHTNDICNGGVGTATVSVTGGTGPFSYLWSNGQTSQTATGLVAGTYEITITDAVGCFVSSQMDSSLYAYIGNSSPVNVTMTNTSTTCTNGSATVSNVTGGTAPYTYVWNTTPPQFTATASGLTFGGYMCTVTDATGCTDIGYTYVNQLPNGLSATTTHADEFCLQANGSASVTVFGGVAPYSYQWSNGATTQSITGLSYGSYQVTVTDANGCPKHQSVYISRLDPISLSLAGTPPSCGNTGGAVSVNVLGGTAPYTYLWNNGATTSSISGLSAGFYSVRVEDANGCSDHNYYQLSLPNNCYALVSGSVTGDQNANCINDGGDFPMGNKIINVGNNWAVTNHLGDYQAYALPGSVTIEQANIQNHFAVACPPPPGNIVLPSVLAGSTYPGNDFFNQPISPVNDLSVTFWGGPARPTAPQNVTIYYRNNGSVTLNGIVNFTHDPLMSLFSGGWNMSNYNLGTRTLTYNLGAINPGQSGSLYCSFTIPNNTTLGTPWSHSVEILPITNDANPADNSFTNGGLVVTAYDPNRKSVMPEGLLTPGADSLLTYTIEFQNTGNDTAFTVALRDTLDADLDALSIEVLGASHPFTWDIDAPGYLEFTFDHIMLPDSHINEPASHGWLMYRIKLKDNLSLGTQVTNTAAIYFDYNAPVITNTTLNTFGLVAVDPSVGGQGGFQLYPNPGHDRVQLLLDQAWSGETTVKVMDLNGRTLKAMVMDPAAKRNVTLEMGHLPAGIYLVECQNGSQRQVQKFVLQ